MEPQTGKPANRDLPPDLSALGIGATTMVTCASAETAEEHVSLEELKELIGSMPGKSMGEFKDITTIGVGGVGAIFAAHEPVLNREIAVKILRPAYQNHLNSISGFIREARITAQIDHPNVIPVHRLGVFDDAGVFFTMKRVEGVTLSYILKQLQAGDPETLRTYTRRRLLAIFTAICNGVAFAHSKGIIHRDLKPLNVMIGDYGEVFIMDWGLAVYRAEHDRSFAARKIEIGELPDEEKSDKLSGTPAFMAPELATGGEADELSDVYALGGILYAILTWEQSPFETGLPVDELMQKVVAGRFLRPRRRAPRRRIPFELEAITMKAMAHDRLRRYESVEKLLEDVRNYLDNFPVTAYSPSLWYRFYKLVRRRPLVPIVLLAAILTLTVWNTYDDVQNFLESRTLLESAQELMEHADTARMYALGAHRKLSDLYRDSGTTEAIGDTIAIRSSALRWRDEYDIMSVGAWEKLRKLLELSPNSPKITKLLARLLADQFHYAFVVGDQQLADRVHARLLELPKGTVKAITDFNPALAHYCDVIEQNSGELLIHNPIQGLALSAIPNQSDSASAAAISLQPSPAINTLPSGSYTIVAALPKSDDSSFSSNELMRFPVVIERGSSEEVALEFPAFRPEGMICVPGGSFIFGNRMADDHAARTTLKGYYVSRHEVTFAEYLDFWSALSNSEKKNLFTAYGEVRNPVRTIAPLWDADGKLNPGLTPDMPVVGITAEAAEAYCRWKSEKTGLTYRLPTALEWEKAARGVDGREYVWGEQEDRFAANVADANGNPGNPAKVESFPKDCSVYGIYDMAGNARELVKGPGGDTPYLVKGSGFASPVRFTRLAENTYDTVQPDLGFRCVVEIPATGTATAPEH